VSVRLVGEPVVRLLIEDDGRGFDPRRLTTQSGFGLISMQERAESVGAEFQVRSSPSCGTQIEVVIP
jgi:signal transduction histidine kinase